MPGRKYSAGSKYRYGFNGKENDNEVKGEGNSYDYGARIYDPRIGRFLSTDPEEEKFPHMTPYQISSNSPIWRIDPDGEWDIEVHAHKTRAKYGYATMIVKNRSGDIIFQTVVKVVGSHRLRNGTNGDTPEGTYKILGWRKTGSRYNTTSFGPNDLLALDYGNNGQGGSRDGMHVHGGRGYYRKGKALMSTHGCMRINDDDIKELKRITTQLEASDKLEKKGSLTVKDDLVNPVEYSSDPSVRRAINGGGDFIQLLKDGFNSITKTFNQIVDALMPQQPVVGIIQDAGGDGYTNMRSSPGSGDPFRVDAGTAVEILQTGDKFTKIKYNNKEGYIHNNYVKKKE